MFRPWAVSKHPIARRQRLEVLIGFTGFFTIIALVNALYAEIRGQAAIVEALILLFFVTVLGLLVRSWRRSQQQ